MMFLDKDRFAPMSRPPFSPPRGIVALLAFVATSAPLAGQNVTLDEGRFALFRGGREVGTETFTIHRVGMGNDARLLASGTISYDGVEMRPALETRPDFVLTRYQNEMTGSRSAELSVVLDGNRYVSRMSAPEGDLQREYRAAPRTSVLENHIAHHYYFLARFADEASTPIVVLVPAEGEQARLEVVSSEPEPFQLGGEQLQSRHLRLQGGGVIRDLWIDDQGRVLRVELPGLDFRAERLPSGS